jgi:diguanylate cyclase (GGDEF)-like protein/PAS domain S-box-containing protein
MSSAARILVVDDEEMNLDLCSRRLRRSGFAIEVATGGQLALEMVRKKTFDLILLDHMMPGMSGSEVLKTLRSSYTARQLPIIMVTALTDSARIAESLDAGANDYITKPIDFTVALARIRSHLSRTEIENALQRSEERYALASLGSNDGLWDWDLDQEEIAYSTRWKSLLGYAKEELGSQPKEWFSRVHPRDREQLDCAIQSHLNNQTPALQGECRMKHKDGSYRWMSVRGIAVRDGDGRPHRMVGSQSDVTEKITLDTLTGLPNRIFFEDRLTTAFERVRSDPSRKFAVMFLDLDRFKLVNDSLGHGMGDKLLIAVAKRLCATMGNCRGQGQMDADTSVVRLGGDEFAVLVEGIPDQAVAEGVAGRIVNAMHPVFTIGGSEVYCSASIGIAMPGPGHSSEEELLRDADTAMYAAKAHGRGKWAVFEASMQDLQQNRLQMDRDLRRAIELSQFEVYYQPRVKLESGQICGFEALVRWNHPIRGLVLPSDFIPAAEESGLIHEIGLWVLREACRQVNAWNLQFSRETPLDVAVNLSVSQCRQPHIVQLVAGVLRETGLPPKCLHLELTESLLIERFDETRDTLIALKNLGIGLKIDDFGTGYSSLKYLAELPFDTLKIDRSFVVDLDTPDRDSVEIVRTIVYMAEALKMGVIAEGIEKSEQVRRLQEMGCRFGQGFYFSRPVSAATTEDSLARGNLILDEPSLKVLGIAAEEQPL